MYQINSPNPLRDLRLHISAIQSDFTSERRQITLVLMHVELPFFLKRIYFVDKTKNINALSSYTTNIEKLYFDAIELSQKGKSQRPVKHAFDGTIFFPAWDKRKRLWYVLDAKGRKYYGESQTKKDENRKNT